MKILLCFDILSDALEQLFWATSDLGNSFRNPAMTRTFDHFHHIQWGMDPRENWPMTEKKIMRFSVSIFRISNFTRKEEGLQSHSKIFKTFENHQTGAYPGWMHRMHVHPPSPPCASPPPGHVHPPPQPEMLVMRKDEAVGNKKKMQVCLPKHNYKLDKNLLTIEPNPDPAQNLDADPDPDPGGGGGVEVSQKCASPLAKS